MNLLILGANSDLALALARRFARSEKAALFLASRDMELLNKRAEDIRIRHGVRAEVLYFDATDAAAHAGFYAGLDPKPDGVILAFGDMGDQKLAQKDAAETRKIFAVNLLGAVSILDIIAGDFERRGHGFIIGVSSVAGERGRQSNYVYGAAKTGLTVYLSGLRNRLCTSGVRVMTVLPGFMATKMTEGMDLPGLLTAAPEAAADAIYKAYLRKKDVIYVKWFWRWIMRIIRWIPEPMFKRLSL